MLREKIDWTYFTFDTKDFNSSAQIEHTRFAQHQLSFWSNFQLTTKPKRQRKIRNDLLFRCVCVCLCSVRICLLNVVVVEVERAISSFVYSNKLRCIIFIPCHTATLYMKHDTQIESNSVQNDLKPRIPMQ